MQLRIYILEQRIGMSVSGWGGGEETRSGTEKQCSHNLQSGHPMWWSEDNSSIFPTVYILIEARSQTAEEMIKNGNNNIMHLCFSCTFQYLSFGTEIWGKLNRNHVRS